MSSLSSPNSTIHLLSKKSRRLHLDTPFFVPCSAGRLLGGLNQRLTPVTSAKLHRRISILDPDTLDFELQPVTVKKAVAILTYEKAPAGPNIPADSTAPSPPGNYAWRVGVSLPELINAVCDYTSWWVLLDNRILLKRYGNRCIMDLSSGMNKLMYLQYWGNHSAISKSFNAMLMRKDLIAAFHNNAFGIDVDDDYRLVIFSDSGVQGTGPDDYFLREHFRHCLLGPWERDDEEAPLDHPRWNSELGKEILECHLLLQFERSGYGSRSRDDI